MLPPPVPGWEPITYHLQKTASFYVVQTKIKNFSFLTFEKTFGTLDISYDGGDRFLQKLIRQAEILSYSTCEDCGNLGCLHSNSILEPGQFATLCNIDALKRLYLEKI